MIQVLKAAKANGCKRPTIIVDVDERWDVADVEALLLYAKKVGADNELAKFVIIFSAAIASYEIPITFWELRCHIISIGEASDEEAQQYLVNCFSAIKNRDKQNFTKEEIDGFTNIVMESGIRNFLDLQRLSNSLPNYLHVSDVERIIRTYITELELHYTGAIEWFLSEFDIDGSKRRGLKVLQQLAEGEELGVHEVAKALGVTPRDFRAKSSFVKPHPFVIDIMKGRVKVESKVMQRVLQKCLLVAGNHLNRFGS